MRDKKPKVLIVSYLPPPVEGTAKIGEIIKNSVLLKSKFNTQFMRLAVVKDSGDRGKLAIGNVLINIYNYLRFILNIVLFAPNAVYMNIAQNKYGFFRDSLFVLTGSIFGKKLIVHFHGGSFDRFYNGSSKIYKKYIRYVFQKINVLILLAEKFKVQFNELIGENRIHVLFNPNPNCEELTFKKSGNGDNVVKILFLGYISKAKGALDLVRAIPLVIKKYPDIVVNLCGQRVDIEKNITFIDEPHFGYEKIMKIVSDNNLEKIVKISNSVTGEGKKELFKESDIFVYPTYSEGCGLAVLEAMSYGLSVITTKVGALEEMLKEGENCLFVELGDYNSIAEKILFLINNPKIRRNMGENNITLVRNRYNPDIFCSELSKIWNPIL